MEAAFVYRVALRVPAVVSVLLVILIAAERAQAEPIYISVRATVWSVNDHHGMLENTVQVGDLVQGLYSYDSGTTDLNPANTNMGEYDYSDSSWGMTFWVGNLCFTTDPASWSNYGIGILNDYGGYADIYCVGSFGPQPQAGGMVLDWVFMQLEDRTRTVLDGDGLLLDAPNVADWDIRELRIRVNDGASPIPAVFNIAAEIDSMVLVPEPATVALLATGIAAMLLRRRRPRA